jgi:hypothetical protein
MKNHMVVTRRAALYFALASFAGTALAACGKKANPERPEDADPQAPRRYPVDRSRPERRDDEPQPETPQSPFLYR